MTKSHEQMEKSIGCGVEIRASVHADTRINCRRDSGNFCAECRVKRDVCDELTAALADTALIDTMERMYGDPLRSNWRMIAKVAGVEIRCSKRSDRTLRI